MRRILTASLVLLLAVSAHAETRVPGAFHSPEKLEEMSAFVFTGTVLKIETVEKYKVSFPIRAKVKKVLKGELEKKELSFKYKHPGRHIIIEKEYNTPEVGQEGTFYIQNQGGTLVLIGYINKTEVMAPKLIGFAGVAADDFATASELGAQSVVCQHPSGATELRRYLDLAEQHSLSVLVKGPGKNAFLTLNKKIDYQQVRAVLDSYFKDNDLAGHKSLASLWLVDEPAHPQKYDVNAEDLWQLFQTVKDYDRRIQLMINFGDLAAYEKFVKTAKPGWRFADIVMFTVTQRKVDRETDYLKRQAEAALRIKLLDPKAKVVPAVAVIEFARPGRGNTEMPSARWVEGVASQCIAQEAFDGLLLYSFSLRAKWMGRIIKDVVSEAAYSDAFKRALANAAAKQAREPVRPDAGSAGGGVSPNASGESHGN